MVNHGGGSVLLCGCFAVAGSGNLDCMKDSITYSKYQAILANRMMPLLQRLKLDDHWTFLTSQLKIQTYFIWVQGSFIEYS